jgi:hypothetical protein
MAIYGITTKIISQLGNNTDSLLPIFAKDTATSTATTIVYSQKGGEHDGKEKAIEEFGTEAIWLGGIPVLKKIIDNTAYKFAKINPEADIRKLSGKSVDSIEYAMSKVGKDSDQYKALEHIFKNQKLAKGLFIGKFVLATAATMAALGALIHFKQKTTEEEIKKKIINEQKNPNFGASTKPENNSQKQSFKGAGSFLAGFMYNPVMNMSILDAGITTKRVTQGRKGERGEILFKEASSIAFYYILAKPIQTLLEKASQKIFKRPISLDFKLLASDEFKNSIKDGSLQKGIDAFTSAAKDDKATLDFVWDNADNTVVKMLKQSGEVPTVKKTVGKILGFIPKKEATQEIDALKFMDAKSIKGVVENLQTTLKSTKIDNLDKYLKQTRMLKTGSIFVNILIAAGFLGIVQPLLAIKSREVRNGNGDVTNPAIKEVEKKIKHDLQYKGLVK